MALTKKQKAHTDWELEQQFDMAATLEELINEPPFKEISGEGGESKTVAARVPLWLNRRARKLKEVEGTPYDLDSDVYRDAIYVGLKVLNMRYKVNPDWDVESKMANIIDTAGMARRLKRQFRELVDSLSDLWQDNDEAKAAEVLSSYVNTAAELESDWHRRRVFLLLKEDKTVQAVVKKCDPGIKKLIDREVKQRD